MIDTIKIQFSGMVSEIIDHSQFGTTKDVFDSTIEAFCMWKHKSTYIKNKDEYLPKVKILKKGFDHDITVEFSAPKLMFDENISELTKRDYRELLRKLKKVLHKMGININLQYLENADVLAIHPSKNLLLNQKYESVDILRELKRVKVDFRRYDIDIKNYRNGGEVLQFYNGESAVVFYDKVDDMKKAKARSIDKCKPALAAKISEQKILRYEVRLNNRKKINKILSQIGERKNIKLKDIFQSGICKQILIKYWDDFFGGNSEIYSSSNDSISDLILIASQNKSIKIKDHIFKVGLKYLLGNKDGYTGVIKALKKYKKSSVRVIRQEIDLLNASLPNYYNQFMVDIEKELAEFKPVEKILYYYGYREQKDE